ncbi:MAG: response regulator [Pyrinomonadaceae bacterium]
MSGSKKYVLVADDNAAILRFITAVVEKAGLETATALDGKAAYKVLKSGENIVCAIIDIRMPYIEGTELVKFMQNDEALSKIPVIMMTGEQESKFASGTRDAGAVAFLPKPFTNHQLRLLLETFIGDDEK